MALQRSMLITGANGNIGQKIARHLLAGTTTIRGEAARWHVKLLDDYEGFCKGHANDPTPDDSNGTLEFVQGDLRYPGKWEDAFAGVDSIMHLQAWNPYPEATWEDCRLSMDMNNNVMVAASQRGVRRLILASSNHLYGRYWREGATLAEAGPINAHTLPNPGTQFRVPSFNCDATPYAAAKLAGESTLKTLTTTTPGFSGIALRIGWCQPGANMPDTMSATGTPTIADDAADVNTGYSDVALGFDDEAKILPWFENMWFSNRDMLQCIERCVDYEEDEFKVIFGMSANSNMRWDISNDIGYEPVDDVVKAKAELGIGPSKL